ncbi:hypothetical protein L249_1423, partial [Ophiocordyceps polyrhachis-furcata BCC 54312]
MTDSSSPQKRYNIAYERGSIANSVRCSSVFPFSLAISSLRLVQMSYPKGVRKRHEKKGEEKGGGGRQSFLDLLKTDQRDDTKHDGVQLTRETSDCLNSSASDKEKMK